MAKSWEDCIDFYYEMVEANLDAHQFQHGSMMLDLIQKLSNDVYLQNVSKGISLHCLIIGEPDTPPSIWIEWIPDKSSYAVRKPMEAQQDFEWSMVSSDNIIQVLQQGLQRLKEIRNEE